MANDPKKREDPGTGVQIKEKPKLEKARRYQVIFHNDDYTTKWFVVDVLARFFHMSEAQATSFMMIVHTHGNGVAGVYAKDIAETKVAEVHEYAREYGMPLRLTVELADD
jgi:ATP-dependent Clp protease adaptor protein ClpS